MNDSHLIHYVNCTEKSDNAVQENDKNQKGSSNMGDEHSNDESDTEVVEKVN